MDRLFDFWARYMKVPEEVGTYFFEHGQIRRYEKGNVFSHSGQSKHYWCFVLEGLVAGFQFSDRTQPVIKWLSVPNTYFTGTNHIFSSRTEDTHIEFLRSTTLFLLPGEAAIEAQRRFASVSEFFHILKQQHINRLRNYVLVFQQRTSFDRYKTFVEKLPELVSQTTNSQQAAFLQLSEATYYRHKRRYLKNSF